MNKLNLFTGLFISSLTILYNCNVRNEKNDIAGKSDTSINDITYDSLTALKYGADEYGMKKYVMAFLKSGPNRSVDSAEAVTLQMAHLKNISKMAEEGTLVLAGPFFGEGETRGIYIFNVDNLEAAEELTNTDPAIQAGSLVMELKEWYGPAGLMAVNEINMSLAKKKIFD
jgi:uncharacterized protein YciI